MAMLGSGVVRAQVAAGGGGEARPDQYFGAAAPFDAGVFVAPGASLSAKQRRERDAAWRAEIRKELFVPEKLPALDARVVSTFSPMPGVLADRVTYATADGMRVPAVVYRPDPATQHGHGKLPGIVVVNGHGGDKYSWYAFVSGMLFARAGAVVVTYDPIGSGERNAQRMPMASPSPHDTVVDTAGVSAHWGQRLAGLMQVDAMQAVSYLRTQKDVDPARIGMVGYSMGAFVAGIAGALDRRVHAVLLSGGGVYDGPHEYYDRGKLPCQAPPYRALGTLGDRGAVLYALNASRGPMLVMNGDADTVMDMAHHPPAWFAAVRQRAIALRGSETDMFTTVLYPGVSHRTSWVNRDGVLWLNRTLRFGLWDDAAIRSAGTTHVATWAKANGVTIAPNYMREDREGGLDAVGTGYPALSVAQLTVLPEAEWQAHADEYTYAGWAAKTRASEGAVAAGR
ncbi:alpha/beta hydrolase family protein [Terriglobus sp.]|uniref:alpha/beta hydrolase family protein n=1 Tax=Terriglobus sp. TaxID=1889013 RepID=UPI003AFFCF77